MSHLIEPLGDGLFLPLNREYKPLSITSLDWIKYEDCRDLGVGASSDRQVYFFNDGNPPWDSKQELASYLDRVTTELKLNKIDLLC